MNYEYKCTSCDCIVTRQRHNSKVRDPVECPMCAGNCERHHSTAPTIKLDPISGDHPGATAKWERMRNQKMAQEQKNMKNHGTYD